MRENEHHPRREAPCGIRTLCCRKPTASLILIGAMLLVGAAHSSPRQSQPPGAPAAPSQSSINAQASTPSAATPAAALRSSTHLVEISVVAQDKKGVPVTDLKQSDFQIFDQGKPQTISVFSMESAHIQAPAAPLGANVYSNRIEEQSGVPNSITVILIDSLNTKFSEMSYVRPQVNKFLSTLQPQDYVAIYGLTTKLTVVSDFTNNPSSLVEALKRTPVTESPLAVAAEFTPANGASTTPDLSLANLPSSGGSSSGASGSSSGTASDGQPTYVEQAGGGGAANLSPAATSLQPNFVRATEEFFGFLDKGNQQISDFYSANNADTTAKALEAIAAHISRLPGRKNLIWISSGFPIDVGLEDIDIHSTRQQRSASDEVQRAIRSLNDSDVAIYPIDARGAIGAPATMSAAAPPIAFTLRPGPSIPALQPDQKIYDTMNTLAERTGGRAFYGTNDFQASIRHAINDARVTYVLGYYPDHSQWNGKFRNVKVKLDRSGVNVRYRRGYFAAPDDPPADPKTAAALLVDAANSPLDSAGLEITVTAAAHDSPDAKTLDMLMKLDPRDFVLKPMGDHWVGGLDFLFLQVGDQGKVLNTGQHSIALNLTQDAYAQMEREGLTLPWAFSVAPGARALRMVARDSNSGRTGSVTVPVQNLFSGATGK